MGNRILFLAWAALLAAVPSVSTARTWNIDQNGHGDFTEIQAAMPACSAGDTILIGPGRWDTFGIHLVGGGLTFECIFGVTQDDLTFIGAGQDATIIGPTSYYGFFGLPNPCAVYSADGADLRFRDIGFENVEYLTRCYDGVVDFRNCSFQEFDFAHSSSGVESLVFQDCRFETSIPGGIMILTSGYQPLLIERCDFKGSLLTGSAIYASGGGGQIRDCYFDTNIGVRIYRTLGSTVTVSGCETSTGCENAVSADSEATIHLTKNILHGSWASLYVSGHSSVTGSNNHFQGGIGEGVIYVNSQGTVNLHYNTIVCDGKLAVKCGTSVVHSTTQDLSLNTWDTEDPEELAQLIWDKKNDWRSRSVVEYLPLDGRSSGRTDQFNWGSIKCLFR